MAPSTSVTAIKSVHGKRTCHMSSDCVTFGASPQALHPTSSLSPSNLLSISSLSAPPTYELSSSLQTQIEHLKKECLSSCLKVCLQHLDLGTNPQAHQEIMETQAPVASSFSLKPKTCQNGRKMNYPSLVGMQSSGTEMHTGGLSALVPITAPSKMSLTKENNGLCTSRKANVSGLNSSRWSRRCMGEKNKQRKDIIRTKPGDCSSSDQLTPGADSFIQVMHFLY